MERRIHIGDAPDRVMAKKYRRLADEAGLGKARDAEIFSRIRGDYPAVGVRVITVAVNTRRGRMRAQPFDGTLDSGRKVGIVRVQVRDNVAVPALPSAIHGVGLPAVWLGDPRNTGT